MAELRVRPTTKYLKAGALLVAVIALALEVVIWTQTEGFGLAMLLPPLLLLWPALKAIDRRFTTITVVGDRLRYETGIANKSTRTIQLSKVQNVVVKQRLMERLWNVGDLSIETAGETSGLTIPDVDAPHALADELLNRAHRGTAV